MKRMMSDQKGVGLIEILVALLVLAIGVLGFIALQYRAVEATSEAINRVQAMNVARDMAERIRANRDGLATYKTQIETAAKQATFATDCIASKCSAADLADFDVSQVVSKASSLGMTMNAMNCQGNNAVNNKRQCLYVAWGDTSATDGTGAGDCTNGTAYQASSTCVIMETY